MYVFHWTSFSYKREKHLLCRLPVPIGVVVDVIAEENSNYAYVENSRVVLMVASKPDACNIS